MDIKVSVKIEGLEEFTQAVGILANAIAMGRATTTEHIGTPPAPQITERIKVDKDGKKNRPADPEPAETFDDPFANDFSAIEDDETVDGPEDPDAEPGVTMEELRAELVKVGKLVSKEASKKILTDLGVDKLQDMDPGDYEKALKMAQAALKKAGK